METKKKSLRDKLIEIIKFLNQNNFNYALIDGIAYSVIFESRATLDIDFIIDIKNTNEFIDILKNNKKLFIFIMNHW